MHAEVLRWLERTRADLPEMFRGRRVLEVGSYNINGSARSLFTDCEYVGLDWRPGPDVDVVGLMHEYHPFEPFDVVVSTEMLEHDPFWRLSVQRMCDVLRPGGALLLTWASPTRERHEVHTAPLAGHYAGIAPADVATVCEPWFDVVQAGLARGGLDAWLAGFGRRALPSTGSGNDGGDD